jgi:HAMP domain-containing protein
MEFLTHSFLGLFAFFPSILLLFGIYLLWEQARQTNKQLDAIARLLTDIRQQQRATETSQRSENR